MFGGSVKNPVELLDLSTWTWETKTPYPFESEITEARIIYVGDKFIMFGGENDSNLLTRITAYTPNTDQWTTEGYLLTPRSNAGVITVDNDSFLIIGGNMKLNYQVNSEKCVYNGDQLECTYQNPCITLPCNQPMVIGENSEHIRTFLSNNFRLHSIVRRSV